MNPAEPDEIHRLRARGAAATAAGRPAEGARTLRAALDLATSAERAQRDGAVEGRILISLAYAEAELGNVAEGLRLLDKATGVVGDQALVHGQRGLLLASTGRAEEAAHELDQAVDALRAAGDQAELARALLNRAYARLVFGLVGDQIAQTNADLHDCRRIARAEQLTSVAIKATQSLGCLQFLLGNMPEALRYLGQAAQECARELPSYLPAIVVDKAKVLLAAGLAEDAAGELDPAIDALRRERASEDLAEAELLRASAALLSGDAAAAGRFARSARRRFRRRDNESGAQLAAAMSLRADFAGDVEPALITSRGARLSTRLTALGLAGDARAATLLTARALLRSGRLDRAAATCAAVPAARVGDSLDLQLLWHLTHAELAAAVDDEERQFEHLRTGLARLHRHRGLLGSIDLQTGITIHGRELAAAGLATALAKGRPPQVFEWTELARAQAFRVTPVRPPPDKDTAKALGGLRHLMSTLHQAERRGEPVGRLRDRRAALERTVRERAWLRDGTGISTPVATLSAVLDELRDRAMIIYLRSGQSLAALVLARQQARLVQLGRYPPVAEQQRRLHADLDMIATNRLPDRVVDVVRASADRDAQQLADSLVTPLLPAVDDRPVVVVPTGLLFTVPWLQLPSMRGRAVVVAPSATVWLAAKAQDRGDPSARPPLLVAGPDLPHAEDEVRAVATLLHGATCLTAARATPAATLAALDGAPLAHIAAHGHHESGNALFSSLELAGGALMGYDLHDLRHPPRHVVLSACDLGMSSVRTGDETVGMVAALLSAGSSTVIASVCLVADAWSPDIMIPYHRHLAGGLPPADALATAARQSPHAGFVCFGSG